MTYSNMWPKGDWARRHLNWALILYSGLALLPVYVILIVGGIVFLSISNKDQMAKENLEREERERYREEYWKRVEAEKQGKGQL